MFAGFALVSLLTFASQVLAGLPYVGIAIPGADFGCDIEGNCPTSLVSLPLTSWGGGDGPGQMQHFVKDDGMNVFRLPATWQFLLDNKLGGTLDATNFGGYARLMQDCLNTGAYCMIDVHNFARWNGGIIGQGGPTNEQFADLWVQLAKQWASNDKVIFGLMNEPHDLDINVWADTCQFVVNAIRNAGASSQMILLPGSNFTNAETWITTGSAAAMGPIKNPDGTQDNLVMDLHKYLDENNSGDNVQCVTNNIDNFQDIFAWLKANNRKAFVSESGASSDPSCLTDFCQQNHFLSQSSDVLWGFVGWGAGSFDSSYILSLTPTDNNGVWQDNELMTNCIVNQFGKGGIAIKPPTDAAVGTTSTSTKAAPAHSSKSPKPTVQSTASTSVSAPATTTSSAHSSQTSTAGAWAIAPLGAESIFMAVAALHTLLRYL